MNINVTQILRPVRLAFLIQPNKKKNYLRAVRVCSALWSGKYFPIFPVFKKFTRDFRIEYDLYKNQTPINFYSKSIENFDPDFIVTDENIDNTFLEKIKGDRILITLREIEESVFSGETKYGIAIDDIISSLKETEFKFERNDNLKIVLPQIKDSDLLTATLFGSASIANIKKIKLLSFPKKYISFPKVSHNNFSIYSNESSLHFLRVCSQGIDSIGNPFLTSQTAVYIIDPNRLNDLINLWNLRALGWNLIAIPYLSYKEDYYTNLIKQQQKKFKKKGSLLDRISVLKGKNIDENTINEIIVHLNSIQTIPDKIIPYDYHWWYPRFWMDRQDLHHDRSASVLIKAKIISHTLNLNEQQIRIPVLYPEFGRKYIRHTEPRFVNEIDYEFDDIEAKYAQVIPAISSKELDIVIKGSGYSQWRFSENGMFFLSKPNDEYLNFNIPKARDVFEKWFKEKGYKIQNSSVGKLSYQLLKNIGGIYGTNFFATPGILPVLNLFEGKKQTLQNNTKNKKCNEDDELETFDFGKIVEAKNLFSEINKQKKHFRMTVHEIVSGLINRKIIEYGVKMDCPYCNRSSFYIPDDFKNIVKCSWCHDKYTPPFNNPNKLIPSYRGIGPFARKNRADGVLTVFLTLRFFRIALFTDSITPILNFEILKNKEVINEVDFAVFFKKFKNGFSPPDLFFCECKTEIDFAKKDIVRMQKLAELFPGSVLVFATLKNQLSDIEKNLIGSLARKYRKGFGSRPLNPILILTGNELLNWLMYDEKIKHLIIPRMQSSDGIGHLCDVTTQLYLGLPSHSSEVEQRMDEKMKKAKLKTGTETE